MKIARTWLHLYLMSNSLNSGLTIILIIILLQSADLRKQVWEIGDVHSRTFLHIANDFPGVSLEFPNLSLPSQTDTVLILMKSIKIAQKIDLSMA